MLTLPSVGDVGRRPSGFSMRVAGRWIVAKMEARRGAAAQMVYKVGIRAVGV